MNINETNRIKLLMSYDVKKTLTENLQLVSEGPKPDILRNFLNVADNALDDIIKKGKLTTTQGTAVKSIDDLKEILKSGSKTALNDASGTLLTNTFLKNPAIRTQDKTDLIKFLTNSDDVIIKYRAKTQSEIADLFKKGGYPDDVADEIANKLKNRPAGSLQAATSAERAQYQKLAQAEKARLGTKNLGQGTREKLIKQVITQGGKTKNLKATHPKPPKVSDPKVVNAIDDVVNVSKKWTWPSWLKWGIPLGLGALGVWWLLTDRDDIIKPDDMPEVSPAPDPNPLPATNRYRDCTGGPYTKGCKTDPSGPIGVIQGCLGLVVDGKFWNKTQAALEDAGFENGFTDAEVDTICNKITPTPNQNQTGYEEYTTDDPETDETTPTTNVTTTNNEPDAVEED